MKKIFTFLMAVSLLSCNSSSNNNSSSDSTTDIKAVQNVNGNIPDTTNSGPINGNKNDSLKVDSLHHK
ncbi:MAG: hypothetical protein NVS1B13_24260 [Flavisolibacter sp.]